MNGAGGRCHDNARCESMWAKCKEEFLWTLRNHPNDSRAVKNPHLEIFHQLLE